MGVPVVYRKSSENTTISYDYLDAIENLGYINYYGCYTSSLVAGDVTSYAILSRIQQPSQIPVQTITYNSATKVLKSDIDWDLNFNVPQIVGGDLYVSSTIDCKTAANDTEFRMDILVYKVDSSSVETLIAQASGSIINFESNAYSARAVTKAVVPRTRIKAGEKIRVNTQFYASSTGSGAARIWFDGANQGASIQDQYDPDDSTADLNYKNDTNLIVTIPFRLDI